jgi:hypothetical protein
VNCGLDSNVYHSPYLGRLAKGFETGRSPISIFITEKQQMQMVIQQGEQMLQQMLRMLRMLHYHKSLAKVVLIKGLKNKQVGHVVVQPFP